ILPNTLGPIIVNGTIAVAAAILTEAALSFIGFGIKPPTPSLGVLIQEGQTNPQQWWLTVFPGETLGIVGESGSGKSVSTMSILGLIPQPPGRIVSGTAMFKGRDLLKMK